jgi:Flp pilus assembly protein TadD
LLKEHAERDQNDTESLIALGDIYRSDKEFNEAIKAYDAAISRLKNTEADHWGIYYARGICYERTGQWEKAENDFNHALELEADQPDVLNYLGYSWLVRGEHVLKAREYIQQAFDQRPADAHIIDSMGWAYYMIGEFGQSVEYLEQAAELTPHDATINEHLGDAYWRVGRQIEAQFQWKRALQFEPEDPKALQAKLDTGLPPFEPLVKQVGLPQSPAPVAAAHDVDKRGMKTE